MKTQKSLYKGFRLVATVIVLFFIFFEEIILKPLRNIKILLLEKTIKRMNGYWTLATLATLKTIEGLCKVVLPFAPNGTVVFIIVLIDGILGFISMNVIIHGHDNLREFPKYIRFVSWVNKLKEDVKQTHFYKQANEKIIVLKRTIQEWTSKLMVRIFGRRNPRGIIRYVKTAIRLRRRRKLKKKSV